MSRSYICKKCKERKRPFDPDYDECRTCRPKLRGRYYVTATVKLRRKRALADFDFSA